VGIYGFKARCELPGWGGVVVSVAASVFLHVPAVFKFLNPSIFEQRRETLPFNRIP